MAIKDVINLGSGSKGNAYFLSVDRKLNYVDENGSDSETFGLLIECGLPFDVMAKRLRELSKGRYSVNDIKVVLITHRHHDHSLITKKLLDMGMRVYAPISVFEYWGVDISQPKYKNIAMALKPRLKQTIAPNITVLPIPMKHDEQLNMLEGEKKRNKDIVIEHKENEGIVNFGYIITINKEYNILFFIDTMRMPYHLRDYKFNMIFGEANHFRLPTQIALSNARKSKDYANIKRYERILYSHMSVETFVKTMNALDLSECKTMFVVHTSSSERAWGDEVRYYQAIRNGLKKDHKKDMKLMICKENGSYATGGI